MSLQCDSKIIRGVAGALVVGGRSSFNSVDIQIVVVPIPDTLLCSAVYLDSNTK